MPSKKVMLSSLGVLALLGSATSSNAAVIVNFQQTTTGVTATATGTLDLSGLTQEPTSQAYSSRGGAVKAKSPYFSFNAGSDTAYGGFLGEPTSLGSSSSITYGATSFGGTNFGMNAIPNPDGSPGGLLFLPFDFTSGSTVNATMTFAGATNAALGLSAGGYQWSWSSDFVRVYVIDTLPVDPVTPSGPDGPNPVSPTDPTPAVPEPATWAMMILGMGAVGFALRRHQKVTTRNSYAAY